MGEVGPSYSMNEYHIQQPASSEIYLMTLLRKWQPPRTGRGLEFFICSQVDSQPRLRSGRYL